MSNSAMDIFEQRRSKLIQLIADDFGGNQAEFCRKVRINTPQLNRWISTTNTDKRNISERSAREIEARCGKPTDWLDMNDEQIREQEILSVFRQLSRYDQESLMLQAVALIERARLTEQMNAHPVLREAQ